MQIRPFHNTDPPHLVRLWDACRLGRGAVEGVGTDPFEQTVFSQSYFDPAGLLVACEGEEIVGWVHAGFAPLPDGSGLDRGIGVICAIVVRPERRRQGVGRSLLRAAEAYLVERGATTILAGPAPSGDPFYFGLYGESGPAGFLESDADACPFFTACGYEPAERHAVFDRTLGTGNDPVDFRLLALKRKTELAGSHQPEEATWWWFARYGRLDTLLFHLVSKDAVARGETLVAMSSVTVLDQDLYARKWHERAVALCDVTVPDTDDGFLAARVLVLEVCRRMKDELYVRVLARAAESDPATLRLFESCGFRRIDTGVVYRRTDGAP